MITKKPFVVHKDGGHSFWQPKKMNGYITVKLSPWTLPGINHTVFFQEMPPGSAVGAHYHEDGDEIFICLDGEGLIILEDQEYIFVPESVVYVKRGMLHSIKSTGKIALKLMVIMTPSGLEERLKQMGKPRMPGEKAPLPFDSLGESESHYVKSKLSAYSELNAIKILK